MYEATIYHREHMLFNEVGQCVITKKKIYIYYKAIVEKKETKRHKTKILDMHGHVERTSISGEETTCAFHCRLHPFYIERGKIHDVKSETNLQHN